jgi:O-antigen ligase
MREIILQPVNIFILLAVSTAYFILVLHFSAKKKFALALEKILIIMFFFMLPGVRIAPFPLLQPATFFSEGKPLASNLIQVVLYGSIILVLRPRLNHIFQNLILLFQQPFLGILLGVLVASMFWSETPLVTLKGILILLGLSVFAVHIGRQYSWKEISFFLRWSSTVIALLSTYFALLKPSVGINLIKDGWQGILGHPIHLGNLMALSTSFWFLHTLHTSKHRSLSLGLGIISLTVMQFANSAGAFCTFLVLIVLLLLTPFIQKLRLEISFSILTIFLAISIRITVWLVENLDKFVTSLGKDLTFTGRVPLWTELVEMVKQRPWLGYGYDGFWQPWRGVNAPANPVVHKLGEWAVHAHNGFLDLVLSLGFVGLLLFVFSFLTNFSRAILYMSRDKHSESVLPLMILIFLIFSNLSETQLLEPGHIWFYYILLTTRLHIDTIRKRAGNQESSKELTSLCLKQL